MTRAGLGLFPSPPTAGRAGVVPGSVAVRRTARSRWSRGGSEHDCHRHRRRPPRHVLGQLAGGGRRPTTRIGRLYLDRRRCVVCDLDRPAGQDTAQPQSGVVRRGLVPGRDHEAAVRPERVQHAVRGHFRLRRLAFYGRRRHLAADLPDDEPVGRFRRPHRARGGRCRRWEDPALPR